MERLHGARRLQLRSVVSDVDDIAERGLLTASRVPLLTATLERNRQWWTRGPLLAVGRRVRFSSSELVWQHYSGEGLQVQWLGTFGKANGLWKTHGHDTELRALLDESLALASRRAGGIAFEEPFPFDGGRALWVSGLTQGTALSALSRAAVRLGDPAYFGAARAALGIFRTPPPAGVAQKTDAGTHYLQYSFAPKLHILNGFVQSLNGLHDFAGLANDDEGRALFAAGEAELRSSLSSFDTGGWSRYSQLRDSDLHYHELLRDFLKGLCSRLSDQPGEAAPYCSAADRFTADLTTPPRLAVRTPHHRPRLKHRTTLQFTIDKPARVSVVISRRHYRMRSTAQFGSGRHGFSWRPPHSGHYRVRLSALDLAGNSRAINAIARVRR